MVKHMSKVKSMELSNNSFCPLLSPSFLLNLHPPTLVVVVKRYNGSRVFNRIKLSVFKMNNYYTLNIFLNDHNIFLEQFAKSLFDFS